MLYRWKKEQEEFEHNSFPGRGKAKLTDESRNCSIKKRVTSSENGNRNIKKGHQHLLRERQEKYGFMKRHKFKYPVEMMCRVLGVSASAYYIWLKSGPSKRWIENQKIMFAIQNIFEESHQSYGSPRVAIELEKRGYKVSRPRTARMMKDVSLDSDGTDATEPNILCIHF